MQSALAAVNAGHEWKRYEIVAANGEIVVSRKLTAFGSDGYQEWIDDQWLADELEWRLGGADDGQA